jgi:hypothetical protein
MESGIAWISSALGSGMREEANYNTSLNVTFLYLLKMDLNK